MVVKVKGLVMTAVVVVVKVDRWWYSSVVVMVEW